MNVVQEHELLQSPHADVDVGSQSTETQIVLRLQVASSITKVGTILSLHCGMAIYLSCGWMQLIMLRAQDVAPVNLVHCCRLIKQHGTHVPQGVEN